MVATQTADTSRTARLEIDLDQPGPPLPETIFGNFLEHLGFAIAGGVWAQSLANPGFEGETYLAEGQRLALRQAGEILVGFYQSGGDPATLPPRWTPGIGARAVATPVR